MTKTFLSLLLSLLLLLTGASVASATSILPPCVHEDCSVGTNPDGSTIYQDGYWDAQNRGNGLGQSFYMVDGVVTPTDGAPVVQSCTEGYGLAEDGSCLPLGYWDTTTPELAQASPAQAVETAYVPTPITYVPAPELATTPDYSTPELATLEAQAWAQWDAVGAASLLPSHATRVTFSGFNTTGFPYLTANMITVWDTQGKHYLFTF
jgi:hypothetical protein